MKYLKYLLLALPAFLCFSCNNYKMQIVSLENQKMQKNDSIWVYHDSLVDVCFYFYADYGYDRFFIQNKTEQPVFFDLKNSFVSVDNFKKDFWSDVSSVDANLTLRQYHPTTVWRQYPITGTISRPDRIVMIPPHSIYHIQTHVPLRQKFFPTSSYPMQTDTLPADWTHKPKSTLVRSVDFNAQSSPSQIRFFLTFGKTEDFKNPMYHDLNFYVSKIQVFDAKQATKAKQSSDYNSGPYTFDDKDQNRAGKHPYKKSWRFYISDNLN